MIEVTRPLASSNDQDDGLFSAKMVYKGDTSPKFEVDTRRAYAGGARSKGGILPADLDFAVHRSAAIGVVNINEMPRPNDYMLLVGGKILAEEVRIKLIKDWADYVFEPNYRLKSLPEVETFYSRQSSFAGPPQRDGRGGTWHRSRPDAIDVAGKN
ncbi:MAG: hypothetical protein ACXW4O_17785 [Candidatus Binatia bacterium]